MYHKSEIPAFSIIFKVINRNDLPTEKINEIKNSCIRKTSILSYIFAHTIEAFQGMKPKEIIPYIEGEPYIGEAPVGERGITVGEAILVKTMNKNGFTAEQIAAAADKDVEEVEAILAGGEPVFA